MPIPAEPLLFGKFPSTLVGPVTRSFSHRHRSTVDGEAERTQPGVGYFRDPRIALEDGSTRDLIFDIPTLVAFASAVMTLDPGDLILTATRRHRRGRGSDDRDR